jgi:hypothetical protein
MKKSGAPRRLKDQKNEISYIFIFRWYSFKLRTATRERALEIPLRENDITYAHSSYIHSHILSAIIHYTEVIYAYVCSVVPLRGMSFSITRFCVSAFVFADKQLMSVWRAAAGLVNIGVLHVQQLIRQASGPCANLLYVVLTRDQQILSQVRNEPWGPQAVGSYKGKR